MTLKKPKTIVLAALLLLSSAVAGASATTLKIGGTGAALGTLRLIGAEFTRQHPNIKIEVLPYIGSTGAIKGVDAGTLDLGLSGRLAKPAEEKLDTRLTRYALTPLVIATHPGNPLQSISRDQLAAIYSGQLTHWNKGAPIRVVLRPAYETDNDVLRSISIDVAQALDRALARPGMRQAATDQDAADILEQIPGTIGTTTLALVLSEKRRISILAIDGVVPNTETLKQGLYPYGKPLYLVVSRTPSPIVQSLIDFIRSAAGQLILKSNGQLPVNP